MSDYADPPALFRPVAAFECQECGLLQRQQELASGFRAVCSRCGHTLYREPEDGLRRALALNISALILFAAANTFPFMTFRLEGREQQSTLISGALEFLDQGFLPLGILVLALAVILPALKLSLTSFLLVSVLSGRTGTGLAKTFRFVETLHSWAMTEVFLLGVLVAYVKLIDLADIALGASMFALVGAIIVMVSADRALEPKQMWDKFNGGQENGLLPPRLDADYVSCHSCSLLGELDTSSAQAPCPRCGAALHARKPNSLSRTWALLLSAFILYIPANVYPIMTVVSFGQGAPDTIISGVVHLAGAGMWPLALLVFFASVMVPMAKLIGLSFLLVTVQLDFKWRPRERTVLYRMVEAVGRWSMIDVFMIAILVALVKLGSVASIEPGLAATSFAAVVVITMIAAETFDPRLIWDAAAGGRKDKAKND